MWPFKSKAFPQQPLAPYVPLPQELDNLYNEMLAVYDMWHVHTRQQHPVHIAAADAAQKVLDHMDKTESVQWVRDVAFSRLCRLYEEPDSFCDYTKEDMETMRKEAIAHYEGMIRTWREFQF